MTLLFSIMVFIFRDETFKLDLTAYILCGFISVGLSILFYTYRDINFDLKSYKQVRQEQKRKEKEESMILKERDLVGFKLILNQNKLTSSLVNFKLCIIESDKK